MPELDTDPPSESALVCWPVFWDEINESHPPVVKELHVSAFYWKEAPPKAEIYNRIAVINYLYRGYQMVKVIGPEALGEDSNYPVLLVEGRGWRGLNAEHRLMKKVLDVHPTDKYEQRCDFTPHCTVDLVTVLDPPKRLILGPLELWYKDDEPVRV